MAFSSSTDSFTLPYTVQSAMLYSFQDSLTRTTVNFLTCIRDTSEVAASATALKFCNGQWFHTYSATRWGGVEFAYSDVLRSGYSGCPGTLSRIRRTLTAKCPDFRHGFQTQSLAARPSPSPRTTDWHPFLCLIFHHFHLFKGFTMTSVKQFHTDGAMA
jgi:hypothetical protein